MNDVSAGWEVAKIDFATLVALTADGLHAHVGIAIMLAGLFLTRGAWPWRPWAVALALELGNEALDLTNGGAESTLAASWHDVKVTMAGPTLLLLFILARGGRGKRG